MTGDEAWIQVQKFHEKEKLSRELKPAEKVPIWVGPRQQPLSVSPNLVRT